MLSLEEAYEILVDEDWYLRQYPKVRLAIAQGAWGTARDHFLHAGYKERQSPGPLFCTEYYCSQSPLYDSTDGVDPIRHYLSVGAKEGASPHWLFSEAFYRASFRDIRTAVDDGTLLSGFLHFLSTRLTEHRRPHPLFCAVWLRDVLAEDGDGRSEGAADHDDLFHHFTCSAHHRGQSPGPLFDPEWYLACYDDVQRNVGPAKDMESAVEHFLRHGIAEGRSPLPDFDPAYYSARHPDVAETVAAGHSPSAVHHWLFQGVRRNADPNRFFNSRYYLDANPHVAEEIRQLDLLGPFEHFVLKGRQQGLRCNQPVVRVEVSDDARKIDYARRARVAAAHQPHATPPSLTPDSAAANQPTEPVTVNLATTVPTAEQTLSRALAASAKYRAQQADGEIQISLVMPTFNRAHALAHTACSIYEHCLDVNFELIIIDDGSTDDTQKVLDDLSSRYPNLTHRRVDNNGPGCARNLGAELANAELLLFIGDDTSVIDRNFLAAHWLTHDRYPEPNKAVLGKIRWSDEPPLAPNFVMTHVQGDGRQQFGYAHMSPYSWYHWQLFYSSNVSIKRNVVKDWSIDGYSDRFYFPAMEDIEFAYRMHERHGSFDILYVPAAVLVHDHPYSVEGFITRQNRAGAMAQVFLEMHPEGAAQLGLSGLQTRLAARNGASHDLPIEHYMNVVEGLKSWGVIVDNHYALGSQNWHADFLNAIFRLAYQEGFLSALSDPELDYCSAYRFILEEFRESMNAVLFTEVLAQDSHLGFV